VDALRQDHVGAYNSSYSRRGRPITPNLDRWARDATVFHRAYTTGGWTSIAIPSMLRGLYSRRLRWTRYYETNFNAMIRQPLGPKLRPGERAARIFPFAYDDPDPPLALRLKRRGMFTAAVIDDGYSQILRAGTGLETGFDVFLQTDHQKPDRRNDRGTVDNALKMLRRMGDDRRFFMWVHLFGPHGPDEIHPNTPVFGKTPGDRYDHEIAYMDRQLNRLLSALGWRKTPVAVFVTADHGELLYSNTRNHGFSLWEGEIRIPLLARVPGWPAVAVPGPVSLVDLVPTVLALTRTPAPADLDGVDLATLVEKRERKPRIILTDTWHFDAEGRTIVDFVAALDGNQKVVLNRMKNFLFAYDQKREHNRNLRIDRLAKDALTRAVYGYLDETGGELHIRD
jgi:arylsulfatase A-like enzyme